MSRQAPSHYLIQLNTYFGFLTEWPEISELIHQSHGLWLTKRSTSKHRANIPSPISHVKPLTCPCVERTNKSQQQLQGNHWKLEVVMLPTLSRPVVLEVVIITTSSTANGHWNLRVLIATLSSLNFQLYCSQSENKCSKILFNNHNATLWW